MDRRAIGLLTAGHCIVDLCQGVVPALMPYFVARYQLGYAAPAVLVLASSLASSVIQPLFGMFADRVSAPWLLPAGVLATGCGLLVAALSPSYAVALVALAVSGVGVAAFHPEAARLIHFASGDRRSTGMSYFSIGGGLGFTAAPLVVAGLLPVAGTEGLLVLLAPDHLAELIASHPQHHAARGPLPPAQWGPFAVLGVAIAWRSAVFVGLMSFLALYWVNVLGQSPTMGNVALTLLLGSGMVGTLAGGRMADRFGRRAVVRWGMLISAGMMGLLAAAPDATTATLLLVPTGIALSIGSSPLVVLGQEYLPGRVGVASGVTLGIAVSCGGIAAPLIGLAADASGVGIVPPLVASLALAAALLTFALPHPNPVVIASDVGEGDGFTPAPPPARLPGAGGGSPTGEPLPRSG